MKLARMLGAGCAVLLLGTGAASAAPVAHVPLPDGTSSLTQDGQQLIWHVVLDHPFSPAAMKHAGQTLCLVFRRESNSSISGVLCVAPPRDGHHPQLVFQRVSAAGAGPG